MKFLMNKIESYHCKDCSMIILHALEFGIYVSFSTLYSWMIQIIPIVYAKLQQKRNTLAYLEHFPDKITKT